MVTAPEYGSAKLRCVFASFIDRLCDLGQIIYSFPPVN